MASFSMAWLRWLGDRPVGLKLFAIVGIALVALVAVGGVGVRSLAAATDRAEELETFAAATRTGLEADMMHDAVRADVLTALRGEVTAALADLDEHSGILRSKMDELRGPASPADVRDAADIAAEGVDTYLTLAERTANAAAATRNPASYPAFLAAFKDVEDKLPVVADAIATHASAASEAVDEQRGSATRTLVITGLVCVALLMLVSRTVTLGVLRPLREVSRVLDRMAGGDLSCVADVRTRDEVGQMAGRLNGAITSVRESISALATSTTTLAMSAEQVSGVSRQISGSASQVSARADMVSTAAGQVSDNVRTAASATGQMQSSIQQISSNAQQAAAVAAEAVTMAERAGALVSKLSESSTEIGNVVRVITSIAEQTDLLALNATIEAARAGDAGRGFAVVAGEVKELALETAKSTEDISKQVRAIQLDTSEAIDAIARISAVVERISEFQNEIASAVEEQSATTGEMTRNMAEAAATSEEIVSTIAAVAASATDTTREAETSLTAAAELSEVTVRLKGLVARFSY